MDERFPGEDEQHARALELLARFPDAVTEISPGFWHVRSSSGRGYYKSWRTRKTWVCECPAAAALAPARCKHAIAVIIARYPEDLGRPIERPKAPKSWKKRRWGPYDKAQQLEAMLYDRLLWRLCRNLPEPIARPGKVGRRPIPYRLQVFIAIKKAGMREGARRARGDMLVDYDGGRGILPKGLPSYPVASRCFNNPRTLDFLPRMLSESAFPLRDLEEGQTVAIDSSGFTLSNRGWYRILAKNRNGNPREEVRDRAYAKGHIIVGCRTKAILAAVVTFRKRGGDSPRFRPLLGSVHEDGYRPAHVVADGAYNSRESVQFASDLGIEPLIPFADGMTGKSGGYPAYHRMWLHFTLKRKDWDRVFHERSLVETVFSAVKKRVGEHIYSRNPEAQLAELLAKFINWNLAVLVRAIFEFGLDPNDLGLSDVFDNLRQKGEDS